MLPSFKFMCSISCTTKKFSILKFCRLNLSLSLCWKSIQVGKQFRDGTQLKSFTTSNRELGSPNMPQSGPWLIHKTGNCINSGNRICTWTQINTKEQRIFLAPVRFVDWLEDISTFCQRRAAISNLSFYPCQKPFLLFSYARSSLHFLALSGALYTF